MIHPVHTRRSIHLPGAGLWLDPSFGVEHAFVSHAHSDHVGRHKVTYCTPVTGLLMRERYGISARGRRFVELEFDEPCEWHGHELRLLPAGHIPGSAMLHLTRLEDGATLLYTGDFKLRAGLATAKAELRRADALILETTFGLPRYVFPPLETLRADVLQFVGETLASGQIPVLFGYSLGKAQEILRLLAGAGYPVMAHHTVMEMTALLAPHLDALPKMRPLAAADARGHVLVLPPRHGRDDSLSNLPAAARTAMLSGWALDPGAKYRLGVDAAFPLSDHADYPELLRTVAEVAPRRIHAVHGFVREFAADLRRRGHDAWAMGHQEQLELGFGVED